MLLLWSTFKRSKKGSTSVEVHLKSGIGQKSQSATTSKLMPPPKEHHQSSSTSSDISCINMKNSFIKSMCLCSATCPPKDNSH